MSESKASKKALPWSNAGDDWLKSGHRAFNNINNPWENEHRDEGDENDNNDDKVDKNGN